MASVGDNAKRYTNTGTIKMEPPPPIKPNDKPTSADAKYPAISMRCKVDAKSFATR